MIHEKVLGVNILCQKKQDDNMAFLPKSRKITSGEALTRE
jgi:hypothetical protein